MTLESIEAILKDSPDKSITFQYNAKLGKFLAAVEDDSTPIDTPAEIVYASTLTQAYEHASDFLVKR